MVIKRCDNYQLVQKTMGFAVFERVAYPSGGTAFWQQRTKWYQYQATAEKKYNELRGCKA